MKPLIRLKRLLQGLRKLESNEIFESLLTISGSILVIEILRFTLDYCVKPLKNWISSMFPEDWGSTK